MSSTDLIREQVNASPVVLYMKGIVSFPQCGFSAAAVQVLKDLNVEFTAIDVLADPPLRQVVKDFSGWPSSPHLFVKGEFIGSTDVIREMSADGELQQLFIDKGITISD
jgi:monothiol glutaredoxin